MRTSASAVRPSAFEAVVARNARTRSGPSDAFEFLVWLLGAMHEETRSGDRSPISRHFYAKTVALRQFVRCGGESTSGDQSPFWLLQLPPAAKKLPPTLHDCIVEWGAIDPADEDNPLWCDDCGRREPFRMKMRVDQFARYVVIHLDRSASGRHGLPDTRRVEYPLQFDARNYTLTDLGIFQLVAVVCQAQRSLRRYSCIVGSPEQSKWFRISEETVTPIGQSSVLTSEAYILFYERK
jgi:ubiquitin C-terminal hydrolase